ncbi:MAG: putative lipid II flippase FtsW [Spirochaetes bacterium]|nr:putative lipid II flippase FtsW [Spirochaetota bacterium]
MGRSFLDLKSIIDTRRRGVPDVLFFLTVFLLAGIGIAMSYSASAVFSLKTHGDSFFILKKQLLWFGIGFIFLILFQEIDYRHYRRYSKLFLLVSFVLLILLLIPGFAHVVKGSARWLRIGGIGFQPSEFVKIFMVIYMAKVFSQDMGEAANPLMQLLIPMVMLGLVFILILLQPDFGTAVDLLIVCVTILFLSGFSMIYIMTLFILSVPAFYLLVYQVEYRRARILAYFDPWQDRYGSGYHLIQSFIAFKMGGLVGVGLGYGTQKISRLPEPHNDFIFAVIAEETGLFGTVAVILIFTFFFWRGIKIAIGASDDFGRLLAIGLTLNIVVQAYINIGVVTGALPTTGIPLPFISYGGSSLVSSMICAGILLNISRYREVVSADLKLDESAITQSNHFV